MCERELQRDREEEPKTRENPGSAQRCFTLGVESRVGTQGQAPGQHIQHAGLHPCYSKQNQNQREVLLGRRIRDCQNFSTTLSEFAFANSLPVTELMIPRGFQSCFLTRLNVFFFISSGVNLDSTSLNHQACAGPSLYLDKQLKKCQRT